MTPSLGSNINSAPDAILEGGGEKNDELNKKLMKGKCLGASERYGNEDLKPNSRGIEVQRRINLLFQRIGGSKLFLHLPWRNRFSSCLGFVNFFGFVELFLCVVRKLWIHVV